MDHPRVCTKDDEGDGSGGEKLMHLMLPGQARLSGECGVGNHPLSSHNARMIGLELSGEVDEHKLPPLGFAA